MYSQKIRSLIEQCDSFFDSVDPKANAKEIHTEMVYQKLSILLKKAIDIAEGVLIDSKVSPSKHPLHGCNEQ